MPSLNSSWISVSRLSRIDVRDRLAVELDRRALLVEQEPVEPQRDAVRIERHAGIAGRRDDSSPVRIGPVQGRLHQRAVGHGLGDFQRGLRGWRSR